MAGEKLLVVDDDQDFAQLLEFDLKKHGYQVATAFNGEEGLEKVDKEKPGLIILDIKMPKMDGYTFVRRIKKNPETKNIPLIVLTSYEPMKDMFQMEGVNDYFVKSVNMEGLIKTIEKNLKARNSS
jgi:CheY-like chemotaxis protein